MGKFLTGCRWRQQQEALLKTKVLSGVNLACSIPQLTSEGVIRPIPAGVDCQFPVEQPNVKEVHRLTNRDGTKSQAIKITFLSAQLPDSIKLDYQEFMVHACVPPVRWCTTCNKLGHLRSEVPVSVPTLRQSEPDARHVPQQTLLPLMFYSCFKLLSSRIVCHVVLLILVLMLTPLFLELNAFHWESIM